MPLGSAARLLPSLVFLALVDWGFGIACLHASLLAVGAPVDATTVLAGFIAGTLATFIAVVPAGIGFMEGSMTAVLTGLGVPLEAALGGALVYRGAYYVIPILLYALGHLVAEREREASSRRPGATRPPSRETGAEPGPRAGEPSSGAGLLSKPIATPRSVGRGEFGASQ